MPGHVAASPEPALATAAVTGLILAGGRGSRLGGIDKGLLAVERPAPGADRGAAPRRPGRHAAAECQPQPGPLPRARLRAAHRRPVPGRRPAGRPARRTCWPAPRPGCWRCPATCRSCRSIWASACCGRRRSTIRARGCRSTASATTTPACCCRAPRWRRSKPASNPAAAACANCCTQSAGSAWILLHRTHTPSATSTRRLISPRSHAPRSPP